MARAKGHGSRRLAPAPGWLLFSNKLGHFQRDCRKKQRDEANGSNANAVALMSSHSEMPELVDEDSKMDTTFAVALKTSYPFFDSDDWLLDSGASRHITCDKSKL
jgi:hypothetical protein